MSASFTVTVPLDLTYHILKHLNGDKATLASCSLVSSQWLTPSRLYLFQVITLEPGYLSPWKVETLRGFLESNPEVQTYVRMLRLRVRHRDCGYTSGRDEVELRALGGLVQILSRLHTLELSGIWWKGLTANPEFIHEIPELTSSHLKTLILRDIAVACFDNLLDVFCMYPGVTRLQVFDIYLRSHSQPWSTLPLSSDGGVSVCAIESFTVERCGPSDVWCDFIRNTSAKSLRMVDMSCSGNYQVEEMSRWLGDMGQQISHFRFDISSHHHDSLSVADIEAYWSPLDLASCKSIQSLHLAVSIRAPTREIPEVTEINRYQWNNLIVWLSHASTDLPAITVEIWEPYYFKDHSSPLYSDRRAKWKQHLAALEWTHLINMLHRFNNLKSVTFLSTTSTGRDPYETEELDEDRRRIIECQMGEFKRAGKLNFSL